MVNEKRKRVVVWWKMCKKPISWSDLGFFGSLGLFQRRRKVSTHSLWRDLGEGGSGGAKEEEMSERSQKRTPLFICRLLDKAWPIEGKNHKSISLKTYQTIVG
jgi:hypothetical protein